MSLDLASIMKIVETMPTIINGLVTLASQLKVGFGGSKKVGEQIKDDLNRAKQMLKEFSTLGHTVKDYIALFGIATDNNNRVDHVIKSVIPYARSSPDQKGAKYLLERDYDRVLHDFSRGLLIFFSITRYIDKKDEGKISTFIDDINNALNQGSPYIQHSDFDNLERLLKDVSSKLITISGICTTKIATITERLIAYEIVLR